MDAPGCPFCTRQFSNKRYYCDHLRECYYGAASVGSYSWPKLIWKDGVPQYLRFCMLGCYKYFGSSAAAFKHMRDEHRDDVKQLEILGVMKDDILGKSTWRSPTYTATLAKKESADLEDADIYINRAMIDTFEIVAGDDEVEEVKMDKNGKIVRPAGDRERRSSQGSGKFSSNYNEDVEYCEDSGSINVINNDKKKKCLPSDDGICDSPDQTLSDRSSAKPKSKRTRSADGSQKSRQSFSSSSSDASPLRERLTYRSRSRSPARSPSDRRYSS